MTKGILNSINTKNALYKILIQTSLTNEDVHSRLKSEYTEYRAKLRKSIREAKRLYYTGFILLQAYKKLSLFMTILAKKIMTFL